MTVCPYCHTRDGCWCPRCFYCGKIEPKCSCRRCLRCQKKTQECTCYQYPPPGGGGGGGSGGGGTTPPAVSYPEGMGELSKAIFNKSSSLSTAQWQKLEKILEKINNDCFGGKLLNGLKNKNISIVHQNDMNSSGSYNHQTNSLKIKDFKETDTACHHRGA